MPDTPIAPVQAPFPMPEPRRPQIAAGVFDIRDFGAVPGGVTKNTAAFRKAIATASKSGGGTVLVPLGRWLTGPIHLASGINLHVVEGAEIVFSTDFDDYLPPVFTRWEGLEVYNYSALIYASGCHDVALTGRGTLNGQGEAWWPWKQTQQPAAERLYDLAARGVPPRERVFGIEGGLRPSFVQTIGCKNVLVEGVTLVNGPMWTIHPVYSENVIVRNVRVITNGPNTDGCNPDSSRNVLIEDSFFSTGDDCIIVKSGLNEDGWRVGLPSENIVVRGIRAARGHGGVGIGSEMSGGVRNVYAHDCEFTNTEKGFRIKSMRGRGGLVENVFYENVRHRDTLHAVVEITTHYQASTLQPRTTMAPTIRGVHLRDITAIGARRSIDIVGLPEAPIRDLTVENVEISSEQGVRCKDCLDVHFENVRVTPSAGLPFLLDDARSVRIDDSCPGAADACLQLFGERSAGVVIDGTAFSRITPRASF